MTEEAGLRNRPGRRAEYQPVRRGYNQDVAVQVTAGLVDEAQDNGCFDVRKPVGRHLRRLDAVAHPAALRKAPQIDQA